MFNKYRGQNQIKNQNSPSDRHERIEKKQPEPAAVEKEAPEKTKKPVFPSSREKKPAPVATARPGADNDLLRQQEEDEWFRKFKGEAEPVINEEPAPEEPLFDDVPDAENDLPSDDGHDEEITPEAEIEEEILPEEENFENYLQDSAVKVSLPIESIDYARFFDIVIQDEQGNKIEPKSAVSVDMVMLDSYSESIH